MEADGKGHQDHPKKEKWNYVQALMFFHQCFWGGTKMTVDEVDFDLVKKFITNWILQLLLWISYNLL
jgi:hypothetical protein